MILWRSTWLLHRWRILSIALLACAALAVAATILTRGASGEVATPTAEESNENASLSTALTPEGLRGSVSLLTLFWPPYTGEDLPFGGENTRIVRSIFEAEGFETTIAFMPWSRGLTMFHQQRVDALFPEYPERGNEDDCLLSAAYQQTTLNLIEPRDAPLHWEQLSDLRPYRIGTVRDYLNSPEIDAMIAAQSLTIEQDNSDITNIRKVAAGRIDGALIDPAVFQYLMENEISLQPLRDLVQVNPKPVAQRTLHVCFHHTPRGEKLREIFDRAVHERGRLAAPHSARQP